MAKVTYMDIIPTIVHSHMAYGTCEFQYEIAYYSLIWLPIYPALHAKRSENQPLF